MRHPQTQRLNLESFSPKHRRRVAGWQTFAARHIRSPPWSLVPALCGADGGFYLWGVFWKLEATSFPEQSRLWNMPELCEMWNFYFSRQQESCGSKMRWDLKLRRRGPSLSLAQAILGCRIQVSKRQSPYCLSPIRCSVRMWDAVAIGFLEDADLQSLKSSSYPGSVRKNQRTNQADQANTM